MTAFHGQMGMFTRALAYILSHGADGLKQVAEDAVLNANYLLRSLDDVLDAPFGAAGPCMHEALFSDRGLAEGFSTLDIAKGLIDEGYHRSEEHTSELHSLMRISYAVFCLQKKRKKK